MKTDLLNKATSVLRDNNFKITKQRKAMLEYLIATATNKYVEVTVVDEFMRQLFPKMSHNTIYRNISEFQELGIVERQVQKNQASVKFQCDFNHEHHHHFVCNNCGKVTELATCPINPELLSELAGYQITGHLFQIYGICKECQDLTNN